MDSCFWHYCPEHATRPVASVEWWRAKLLRNRERDADTDERLRRQAGYSFVCGSTRTRQMMVRDPRRVDRQAYS